MPELTMLPDLAGDVYHQPSDEAMEHLALLLIHREHAALTVTVRPYRCPLCRELALWSDWLAGTVTSSSDPDHESEKSE